MLNMVEAENFLEGINVSYQYHKIDIDENDFYYFKVEDAESIDKINKFCRKHWGHNVELVYRKCFSTYVKVKHENIEDFFNINFEKGAKFKTNLLMHSIEDDSGCSYFPKMSLEEDE